jgi:hypothetical protein
MASTWCFGYSTLHVHVVFAVKYTSSNIGEKPVNKEAGSKRQVSLTDIRLEGGHQPYVS